MAITTHGFFVLNMRDALGSAQLGINFTASTLKGALFPNSITPNFDTDVSYNAGSYVTANEVTGTGWSAGGIALVSPTLTASPAGTLTWDASDMNQAGVTISGARGMLIYDNALTAKNGLAFINFGTDYTTGTGGTFSIQWPSGGIATLRLV